MSAGGANTAGVSSSLDLNYINVMIFMNIYIYCLQVKNGGKDGGGDEEDLLVVPPPALSVTDLILHKVRKKRDKYLHKYS